MGPADDLGPVTYVACARGGARDGAVALLRHRLRGLREASWFMLQMDLCRMDGLIGFHRDCGKRWGLEREERAEGFALKRYQGAEGEAVGGCLARGTVVPASKDWWRICVKTYNTLVRTFRVSAAASYHV